MTITSDILTQLNEFSDRYQALQVRDVRPFVIGLLDGVRGSRCLSLCDEFHGFKGARRTRKAAIETIIMTIERRVLAFERTKRI